MDLTLDSNANKALRRSESPCTREVSSDIIWAGDLSGLVMLQTDQKHEYKK